MAWYHRLPFCGPRKPLRAGVLNTGELILVDDAGHSQVFTECTTDLIRDVLGSEPPRFVDTTPLPPIAEPFPGLDTAPGAAHEFR